MGVSVAWLVAVAVDSRIAAIVGLDDSIWGVLSAAAPLTGKLQAERINAPIVRK
jgi:hypothetical protein